MKNESFLEYYNTIMDLVRRIRATGTLMEDSEVVMKILESLPSHYSNLITPIKIMNRTIILT